MQRGQPLDAYHLLLLLLLLEDPGVRGPGPIKASQLLPLQDLITASQGKAARLLQLLPAVRRILASTTARLEGEGSPWHYAVQHLEGEGSSWHPP
jgi:hypothetical protein